MHESSIGGSIQHHNLHFSHLQSHHSGEPLWLFFLWHGEFAKWATLSLQGCQSFILVIFLAGERIGALGASDWHFKCGKKKRERLQTYFIIHYIILTEQERRENKKPSYWIKIIKNCSKHNTLQFKSRISTAKCSYDIAQVRSMIVLQWWTFYLLPYYLGTSSDNTFNQSYHCTRIVHTHLLDIHLSVFSLRFLPGRLESGSLLHSLALRVLHMLNSPLRQTAEPVCMCISWALTLFFCLSWRQLPWGSSSHGSTREALEPGPKQCI